MMNMKRFQTFASLHWYEQWITFLFTFTAKTSELLLAAGLVVSTANFLTDGNVMGHNATLAAVWAWAQALAIDSGLGITFSSIFQSIKQRDWIKAVLYGLLTLLLAIVAGTITNVDTFSHAVHTSIQSAMSQVGLDVKILTTLRAVAVVGFVMLSRLKEVSFKQLYEHGDQPSSPTVQEAGPSDTPTQEVAQLLLEQQLPDVLAHLRQALFQPATTRIPQQEVESTLPLLEQTTTEHGHPAPVLADEPAQEESPESKLERAYQQLQASGDPISGRALAKRAHVHRATCNRWLKQKQSSCEQ